MQQQIIEMKHKGIKAEEVLLERKRQTAQRDVKTINPLPQQGLDMGPVKVKDIDIAYQTLTILYI